MDETYNNRPLFRKQDDNEVFHDRWLRYTLKGVWAISSSTDKDANNKNGWVLSKQSGLALPVDSAKWTVYSDGKWGVQASVKVHASVCGVCVCRSIHRRGLKIDPRATGLALNIHLYAHVHRWRVWRPWSPPSLCALSRYS